MSILYPLPASGILVTVQNRVRSLNDAPVRGAGRYVLYWMQANQRADSNHALAYAAQLANSVKAPLLCYQGLTHDYPHANDRLHTFILEGVAETERRLRRLGAGYVFYLRRRRSDPNDILYRLAAESAAVVTDDYPAFLAARHNRSVPPKLGMACLAVDSSCVVPMSLFEKREYAAYTIRPKITRLLPKYLKPLETVALRKKYRLPAPEFHTRVSAASIPKLVAGCDIDHSVPPSTAFRGGRVEAERRLQLFLAERLYRYASEKNQPTARAVSDLSPYLHFGQISALEVALAVKAYAAEHKLMAEEFLEELIVRRELAFNHARHAPTPGSLALLPEWARQNLDRHKDDRRSPSYGREPFAEARTHDRLWNATQTEMLRRGKIHGYYRMYWGKKIVEWSPSAEEAFDTMVEIHDRYALDGRDPNTYANVLWCFGLFDRPFAGRPVFGTIRYMSLEGMRRKTNVDGYVREMEGAA